MNMRQASSSLLFSLSFLVASSLAPERAYAQSLEELDLLRVDPSLVAATSPTTDDPPYALEVETELQPASLRDGRRMLYAGAALMSSAVLYAAASRLSGVWDCDDENQRNDLHPVGFGLVASIGGTFSFVGGGRIAGARMDGRGGRLRRRDRWQLAMETVGIGLAGVGFMSLLSHAGATRCRGEQP